MRRAQHLILLFLRKRAVKRHYADIARFGRSAKLFLASGNLALARKKAEYVARRIARKSAFHRRCDGRMHRGVRRLFTEETRLDGIHPRFGRMDVGIAQMGGDRFDFERRRHYDYAQIGTERAADVESEREAEIAGERAFVKFVEND